MFQTSTTDMHPVGLLGLSSSQQDTSPFLI